MSREIHTMFLDSFGEGAEAALTVFAADYLKPATLSIGPIEIQLTDEQLKDIARQFHRAVEWREENGEERA